MPSVYGSVFQSFIRSGFSKSFTHGYAQSIVNHGGLDAYFEQLQKAQASGEVEEDWEQFQFPKRIEWKPTPASILVGPDAKTLALNAEESAQKDDVSTSPGVPPEAEAALAHIDAAIEKEIELRERLQALEEKVESLRATSPELAEQFAEEIRSLTVTPFSRAATPVSSIRSLTPPVDPQSQSYADHLTKLSEAGRYAEIPAVFEAMLVGGIRPIATAYNALLMAAIHLPLEEVSPDSDTYNILVGLLASRSLEIASLKQLLEDKRLRFGGMDEPGKFMFASHELEHAMLVEDDRLNLAMQMFESSVMRNKAAYSSETYHQLISACARSGRVTDMLQLFEHMEHPFAATFPAMITAFANNGDLVSAVECYNEYRNLAIANDKGEKSLKDRLDAQVYAAVIYAYVVSDKVPGAVKFFQKLINEYGVQASEIKDSLITSGFIPALIDRGVFKEAVKWAENIEDETKSSTMAKIATRAADRNSRKAAIAAFVNIHPPTSLADPAIALLAMSIRRGDVTNARRYWDALRAPEMVPTASFIEPTTMYAVAMIGSGNILEGVTQAEQMFQRIRDCAADRKSQVVEEIEEGTEFISRFMAQRGLTDPRIVPAPALEPMPQSFPASPHPSVHSVARAEDTFDPYSHNADLKASFIIAECLENKQGRKGPNVDEALHRFRNVRRAGRHPRYITYAKLITAVAKTGNIDRCQEILAMARSDMPPLPQYSVVRHGWSLILDASIGACLTLGRKNLAEQYHQELLSMGATPSANTYGLYITTLGDSGKTFDEASEAVKIFIRAKKEGVEPSSFLYNALIGKLGKARRIDDCLFYFAEMRALGIKPTSVTYGTIVNALCRVSDETFAEELFREMESMPNYKARPAPYNSMMQFFLTTKRDKAKVLEYYARMKDMRIAPTAHTFKLLVDTHATLDPVDMPAAAAVLDAIRAAGLIPEPVHYASLIHARGCVQHDMAGARAVFDAVVSDASVPPHPCLYQALFEAMVANHRVADTEPVLNEMRGRDVAMTPYIANTLIHGWAAEKNIAKAKDIYTAVGRNKREPSTYEAMTRAYLAVQEREGAKGVVSEMLTRGYPSAVVNKVLELLGGVGSSSSSSSSREEVAAAA
ncbi:hypothetical protein N0V88_003271 [Collariella sp. IMI 366227]|nr:hypothetical protein N0V88_003271 [Collariella sp. IMI 366227]